MILLRSTSTTSAALLFDQSGKRVSIDSERHISREAGDGESPAGV